MKSYWIPALSLALLTTSVATQAHMPHEHTGAANGGPGHHAMLSPEMRVLHEDMQSKMAAAKTPEERQALMKEQHDKMGEKMPGMTGMAMGSMGHMGAMGQKERMQGMGGMGPMNMRHHQQMMQEQRPQSGG